MTKAETLFLIQKGAIVIVKAHKREIIQVSYFLAGQASHGLEELKNEFEQLNDKQIMLRDPLGEYHRDSSKQRQQIHKTSDCNKDTKVLH
ncbi:MULTISPECIES: hypothetical protein [unclassified Lactococcus]|uniref:hypothetical protein n=1 Tax=unclassified Lactococcus TaxID=2643510 RepID=UPI0011CB1BAE|nr:MULTISPECIES: hypothetical protein [unclassified Lactococcus]MQW23415.1 hypothetical protein [Lactococcus sp. dk101]TXK37073.1 hypothetical protein FVP42_10125 [Lactococcus sp. dk310]TXK37305.1 hypothetical protein FVP42_09355 [Lactococcus sp. dk310]TXK47699.1 hypothetical protein FVP43_09730 [Lactococcus sp. dk322]